MFGLLAQYWLDQHHADGEIQLALHPSTSEQQQASCQEHVVACVPIHCIVVSSASTYFSALLGPAWQQDATTAQQRQNRRTVKLVLCGPADVAAMLALLKCIYTGDLDVNPSDLSTTLAHPSTPGSASASVQDSFAQHHWQQLHLRAIKLADQFAVAGVMEVAVCRLTRLFSHQLEWATIEAVLWMPPSMASEPRMAALRQLAVSGAKQRLGVLDSALAQPAGRQLLQGLPPDALAALLGSDTLAVTSENTVLAAIDTWAAGSVAHALATQQQQQQQCGSCCRNGVNGHPNGLTGCVDAVGDCHMRVLASMQQQQQCVGGSGAAGALAPSSSSSDSGHSSTSSHMLAVMLEGSGDSEEAQTGPHHHQQQQQQEEEEHGPLLSALALLVGSVRLNQVLGGFLAAAVERMPWLCRVLQHRESELQLLQQYYSSDSEGRYQLSMHLIQQTICCPWQPRLRKALPPGYNSSLAATTSNTIPTTTGSSGGSSSGGSSVTGLSELRSLLDTFLRQQMAHKVALFQAVCSPAAPPPGVLLAEFVMGGYAWRLSLVAAPFRRPRSNPSGHAGGVFGPAAVGEEVGRRGGLAGGVDPEEQQQQQHRQQLALAIICRPAWSTTLEQLASSSSSRGGAGTGPGRALRAGLTTAGGASAASAAGAGVGREHQQEGREPGSVLHDPAAVAAASILLGQSAGLVPDCECATGAAAKWDAHVSPPPPPSAAAAAAAAGELGLDFGSRCSVCRALCSVAVSKAAIAVDRHCGSSSSGMASAGCTPHPCGGRSGSGSSSSGGGERTGWCVAKDVLVGVYVAAAPSAPLLQGLLAAEGASRAPAEACMPVRLCWSEAAGAAYGLVPLDVSAIGAGGGGGVGGVGNSSSSNLVCGWACRPQEVPAGGVRVVVASPTPTAAAAAAAGGGGGGGGGGSGSSSLVVGWQPELWSRVAYTGELHWHTSLRLLSD